MNTIRITSLVAALILTSVTSAEQLLSATSESMNISPDFRNNDYDRRTLSVILQTAPSGIGMVKDRVIYMVNDYITDLLGYSEEEILGQNARIFYPSDRDYEYVGREKYRQIAAGGTGSVETRWLTKDGRVLDVILSSTPLDPDDLSVGVIFTVQDITETKRTAQVLQNQTQKFLTAALGFALILIGLLLVLQRTLAKTRASETDLAQTKALFQAVIEQVPAGMLIADAPDVRIRMVNPAGLGIRGESTKPLTDIPVELHPQHWQTFWNDGTPVAPEDLPLSRAVLKGETATNVEVIIRRSDGEPRWVLANAAPVRDPHGKIIAGVVVFPDITERKQAEERLHQSQDFLRMTQRVAHLGGWMTNIESDDLIWDDGVYDIIEESHDYHPGLSEGMKYYCPEYLPSLKQGLTRCLATGEPFSLEAEIITGRGNRRWVEVRGLTRAESGKTPMVIGTIQDITERKLAEEEREKLRDQLIQAQKMESIGRLAGGVAHDFNNMLMVIGGNTDMALEKATPADPIFADLLQIRRAFHRSAELTRQLLGFARKQTIAPKDLDLNDTVESMLTMLRRLIGENIDLLWLPGRSLGVVRMDPSQLDQILANLCLNARDAIGSVGKVTIETDSVDVDEAYCSEHIGFTAGRYVLLAVSDNGCGMSRETLDHLFEPFFTTKSIGEGTGLGLATVYGIVRQNNGFINVYSELGQGTTFRVYLPLHEAPTRPVSEEETKRPLVGGDETVLLVEDEPAILKLASMMLERWGYTVLACNSPEQAMEVARKHGSKIHLLITDVIMPQMNGRDLAKNLMSLYPEINALFMSGYTANVIAHHGVLDSGVHFIQKPFTMEELTTKVRVALDSENSQTGSSE